MLADLFLHGHVLVPSAYLRAECCSDLIHPAAGEEVGGGGGHLVSAELEAQEPPKKIKHVCSLSLLFRCLATSEIRNSLDNCPAGGCQMLYCCSWLWLHLGCCQYFPHAVLSPVPLVKLFVVNTKMTLNKL